MTAKKNLPVWWTTLQQQYEKGIGRVFILHNNVNDLVYYPPPEIKESGDLYYSSPHPFRDMLMHFLAVEGGFGPILYYSPTSPLSLFYIDGSGIHSLDCVDLEKLSKELEKLYSGEAIDEGPEEDEFCWDDFAKNVGTKKREKQDKLDVLFNLEPCLEQIIPEHRIVLILDFFEKITTRQEQVSDFQTEEIIRRWALSDRIKNSPNIVIGMTVDYESLPKLLRTSDSGIQNIEVPMPGPVERAKFLGYWRTPSFADSHLKIRIAGPDQDGFEPNDDGTGSENVQIKRERILANITKGFRLVNLDTMCRTAVTQKYEGLINKALLKKQKATLINEESAGLLEEIQLKHTFDDIGGLEYAKKYFRRVAENIPLAATSAAKKRGVPKGILLCGPPGTGKTVLAEALAGEAGITLVRLGDIQASHVGESERNMTRALKLLEELAPVVVFVDEIDQSLGRRSAGNEGDSGVNRRLFGKLLEFMGDNKNRGKVLWVAASNRPDYLDQAMISRFDAVMAILPPYTVEECKKILQVMESRVEGISYSTDFLENIDSMAEMFSGLPGRTVETLVRKSAEIALEEHLKYDGDESIEIEIKHMEQAVALYKPNTDIRELDAQTVRALMVVNFTDMLPAKMEMYPERLRTYVEKALHGNSKSNQPLQECLEEILDKNSNFYS